MAGTKTIPTDRSIEFRINKTLMLLMAIVASTLSSYSPASGFARPGPGGLPQQAKDPAYERGKALFKGRIKNYHGVQVCLQNTETGKLHKPSKSKLKPYRKAKAVNWHCVYSTVRKPIS